MATLRKSQCCVGKKTTHDVKQSDLSWRHGASPRLLDVALLQLPLLLLPQLQQLHGSTRGRSEHINQGMASIGNDCMLLLLHAYDTVVP